MTCFKCGGLMRHEQMDDYFVPFSGWHCMICGYLVDRQMLENRMLCQSQGVMLQPLLSDAKWREAAKRNSQPAKKTENEPMVLLEEEVSTWMEP